MTSRGTRRKLYGQFKDKVDFVGISNEQAAPVLRRAPCRCLCSTRPLARRRLTRARSGARRCKTSCRPLQGRRSPTPVRSTPAAP